MLPTFPGRFNWLLALAFAPFLIAAATVFVSVWFPFLQTDDFCTYSRVLNHHHGNPFDDVVHMYRHWTGRYSAMFSIALVAASSPVLPVAYGYSFALACCCILFAWACWRFSSLLDADRLSRAALSAILFCATMIAMPSKLEQFLWLTGAAVYFIGASMLLLLVQAIAMPRPPGGRRVAHEAIIAILIVTTVGFNEFLALTTGALVTWYAMHAIWRQRAYWPVHAVRLAIFAAAFAAAVLAPGNFARDATSSATRHKFGDATSMAMSSLLQFIDGMTASQRLPLLAALLGAAAAGALAARTRKRAHTLAPAWRPVVLLLLAAFPMHLWVYSFLTGEPTPGRVINQAFMLALAAVCLAIAICFCSIATRWQGSGKIHRAPAASITLLVAGLGLLGSHSFRTFAYTIRDFAPRWHAQQLERHHGLTSLSGSGATAYVRPFDREILAPPVFSGTDVQASPTHWINRCVASYYKVPAVIQMRRTTD